MDMLPKSLLVQSPSIGRRSSSAVATPQTNKTVGHKPVVAAAAGVATVSKSIVAAKPVPLLPPPAVSEDVITISDEYDDVTQGWAHSHALQEDAAADQQTKEAAALADNQNAELIKTLRRQSGKAVLNQARKATLEVCMLCDAHVLRSFVVDRNGLRLQLAA